MFGTNKHKLQPLLPTVGLLVHRIIVLRTIHYYTRTGCAKDYTNKSDIVD